MDITILQGLLNKFFNAGLNPDGDYGKYTKGAVVAAKAKLKIDTESDSVLYDALKKVNKLEEDFKRTFVLYEPLKEFGKQFPKFDPVILMAQFGLETAYLTKVIKGSYNLGNIKARDGEPFVLALTTEYVNGKPVKVPNAKFKKYNSYDEFFKDYFDRLLGLKRYAEAKANLGDALKFYSGLIKGGYATDPNYVQSLMGVYRLMNYYRIIKGLE